VQDIFVILGAFLELGGGMRLMAFGSLISTVGITSLVKIKKSFSIKENIYR
jgi:hypothetical protein